MLKLHGSCNFIISGLMAGPGISYTRGISFGGGIRAVDPSQVIAECRKNVIPPSMSIYMRGKPTQTCPDTIVNIRGTWQSLVKQTSKLFIIGVNPNAEDSHIWDSIAESSAKIYFIGDSDKFIAWLSKTNRKKDTAEVLANTWESGMASLKERL